MNREELKLLADARVADAEVLLQAGRWPAAYYLLGYAVECALKACIAKEFHEHEVPDKQLVLDFYTHNLAKLLGLSGVNDACEARMKRDHGFKINWHAVRMWSERSRYYTSVSERRAKDLYDAVCNPQSGVLSWLKTMW